MERHDDIHMCVYKSEYIYIYMCVCIYMHVMAEGFRFIYLAFRFS